MKKQFIKRWFLMLRFTEFRALSIFKIGGNAMVTVTKIEFGVNYQIYFCSVVMSERHNGPKG